MPKICSELSCKHRLLFHDKGLCSICKKTCESTRRLQEVKSEKVVEMLDSVAKTQIKATILHPNKGERELSFYEDWYDLTYHKHKDLYCFTPKDIEMVVKMCLDAQKES